MNSYANKTVLVAGGTIGINLAIAEAFAQAGARVAVMSRSADKVASAVAHLRAMGATAVGHAGDVPETEDVAGATWPSNGVARVCGSMPSAPGPVEGTEGMKRLAATPAAPPGQDRLRVLEALRHAAGSSMLPWGCIRMRPATSPVWCCRWTAASPSLAAVRSPRQCGPEQGRYSTVTDFARLRGLSTSVPRIRAV